MRCVPPQKFKNTGLWSLRSEPLLSFVWQSVLLSRLVNRARHSLLLWHHEFGIMFTAPAIMLYYWFVQSNLFLHSIFSSIFVLLIISWWRKLMFLWNPIFHHLFTKVRPRNLARSTLFNFGFRGALFSRYVSIPYFLLITSLFMEAEIDQLTHVSCGLLLNWDWAYNLNSVC
jgi:hypothetical protein